MRRNFVLPWVIIALIGSAGFAPLSALAQPASQALPGITVVGNGEATAPADTVTLLLIVGEPSYGPPPIPQPGVVPGERERETIAPVIAALVAAGIQENAIDTFVGSAISGFGTEFGPATAALRVTLDAPTVARINDLIAAATMGAAAERLIVARVIGVYSVENCDSLDHQALEQAVTNARMQAGAMADLLGVSIGEVISLREFAAGSPAISDVAYGPYGPAAVSRTCEGQAELAESISSFLYLPPLDLLSEPEVSSYASVELTFSIEGAAAATPAA